MVGAVTKEESGVSKPEELNLGRPVDKRASLSDHNKGIKSSLLGMISLEYVWEKNSPPHRVSLKGSYWTINREYHTRCTPRSFMTGTKLAFHLFSTVLTL